MTTGPLYMRVRLHLSLDVLTTWQGSQPSLVEAVCLHVGIPLELCTELRTELGWHESAIDGFWDITLDLTTVAAARAHADWMARAARFSDPVALAQAALRGEV